MALKYRLIQRVNPRTPADARKFYAQVVTKGEVTLRELASCPCRCNFPHFGRSIIPCLVIPSDVFKLYLIPFLPHLIVRRPSFDSLMPAMIFLQHVHSL
jgi:hypothetical protein